MATHCSTHAWKIPWMEEPGRLQSMGRTESDMTEVTQQQQQQQQQQRIMFILSMVVQGFKAAFVTLH